MIAYRTARLLALATTVVAVSLGACTDDGRTVLTIYSPHGSDLLGSWRNVYLMVLGTFVLFVVLFAALTWVYS